MELQSLKRRLGKVRRGVQSSARLRRKKLAIEKHGLFYEKDLFAHGRDLGVEANDVLLVHCSMDNLFTYGGSMTGLIKTLLDLVAPNGTLLMPALTTNIFTMPTMPFDVMREPTYTGIIPEIFRRMPGVIRSLHPRHSICALGPLAQDITKGHEECIYADGAGSPWDRLRLLGAKGLNLGLVPGEASTFLHWIDDIEPEKYPIPIHVGPVDCVLIDKDKNTMTRSFYNVNRAYVQQPLRFGKKLSDRTVKLTYLKGIPHSFYNYRSFSEELVALRDRGIIAYRPKYRIDSLLRYFVKY